ncbi:SH3 domain-containing protein [Jannaschia sp. 2305UL9-9]|uniref:SH3 domain-containing protein n=1 Tax=Jannaschia sp. 2305UL9-9 TaxID=3121638 RepID=UPI003526F616
MRALAVLLIWLAAPAFATQDAWPALFDVTGVAVNDVLNIRSAPDAGAAILGTLAPDATGVEVIAPNDTETWGQVNVGEGVGWVSLTFLDRRPGQWTYSHPQVTRCFGTEPFWTLHVAPQAAFLTPAGTTPGTLRSRQTPLANLTRHGLTVDLADRTFRGVLMRNRCSDGMSDRAYGIEVVAFHGNEMLAGCCTLAR